MTLDQTWNTAASGDAAIQSVSLGTLSTLASQISAESHHTHYVDAANTAAATGVYTTYDPVWDYSIDRDRLYSSNVTSAIQTGTVRAVWEPDLYPSGAHIYDDLKRRIEKLEALVQMIAPYVPDDIKTEDLL